MEHATTAELEAGLEEIRRSPADAGALELVVRRPAEGEREVLQGVELNREEGLAGDHWRHRPRRATADGSPHPDRQLTLMNARAIALLAGDRARWPLAGDQLYVDLDLSTANLPPGSRLAIGSAVVEITDQPHLGCAKFSERFGQDALRFVNARASRALNLRGVNARVVEPGTVRRGDVARKVAS
jgi:MOSC domain-containing protein YiiM